MATKQPVKKKDLSSSSLGDKKDVLNAFKTKNDLNGVKDKELEWIVLPEGFYDAVKLPGIPKGFVSDIMGHSDTGKSTFKLEIIAQCQRMGILPVIYETEGNFPWEHARMCGVEFEEVYEDFVDEETGETERRVIDHNGFFLYYDADILFKKYGRMDYSQSKELSKPNRKVAVIEDIAYSINELLDLQGNGPDELDYEMCFIWDSVGSIPSYRSVMSKTGNNMFDAGAIKSSFNTIGNNRIPLSRKEGSPYTNTMFFVNKVWVDNMQMGAPQIKTSGGDGTKWFTRLRIHLGGVTTSSVEKLSAVTNGKSYRYGITTKIKVVKNQVTGIEYEGKISSLSHGLWNPEKIDSYKKQYSKFLLNKLSELTGKELSDDTKVEFSTEQED
jgi:hypothetical protein